MRTVHAYAYPAGENPHEVIVELDDDDEERWEQRRREERGEFDPDASGSWLRVVDQASGARVELRTFACGLGCRCAAQAH